MDQPARDVEGEEAEQPKDDEKGGETCQHGRNSLFDRRGKGDANGRVTTRLLTGSSDARREFPAQTMLWMQRLRACRNRAGRDKQGTWVADDKSAVAEAALPAGGCASRPGVEADLAAIVEGIAAGERAALKELYDRFGARLYGIAQRILRDNSLAEDALQEAFVKIWRNAGKYDRDRGSALGWVVIIVRRAAFDIRPREPVAEPAEIADLAVEQPQADMLDPGLARALAALPETQRRALLLTYVYGLTNAELAAAMGAPLGTVKSWVRRAAAALKESLGDG